MLKPPNGKSRQSVRRSVDDKVCDEVWDEVWELDVILVETALGQPYLDTKGAFMPALYPIPGFSTHPDHIQTHTISPHKPGSALFCG
jgi:hypothetical protein